MQAFTCKSRIQVMTESVLVAVAEIVIALFFLYELSEYDGTNTNATLQKPY